MRTNCGRAIDPSVALVRIAGATVVAFSLVTASAVLAEDKDLFPSPVPGAQSVNQQFEDTFFSNDRDFVRNRSAPRQLGFLTGLGIVVRDSFPENEIARDGKNLLDLYRQVNARQVPLPVIRTPDLPTPFNTSILTSPMVADADAGPPAAQPTFSYPGDGVTAPPTAAPSRGKVPALW